MKTAEPIRHSKEHHFNYSYSISSMDSNVLHPACEKAMKIISAARMKTVEAIRHSNELDFKYYYNI